MVRWFRKARSTAAKFPQAIQWSHEVRKFVNDNYPGVTVQVFTEAFGDTDTIYWFIDFENLAALEAVNAKLGGDPGYWALMAQTGELFIEGSGEDTLVMSA